LLLRKDQLGLDRSFKQHGEEAMSRELKLKNGWLRENLDRAEKSVHEWNSHPAAKAQDARVRERQSSELRGRDDIVRTKNN
jgi:hypothetical protein